MSLAAPLLSVNATPTHRQPDENVGTHLLAEELLRWFTQHGGRLSPDVRIAHTQSRGFHMQAVRPLGSPAVVTCPLKLTLSCLNLDPQQQEVLHIDSPLQQCRGTIPDHILTYLLLVEQQQNGEDSAWHNYIRCLPGPESMTTPLWFHDEDMAFLAGTSLAPAAKDRKREYHQQWEHALSVMKESNIALADEVTFDSLLWAATIFTSRAFISTHVLPGQETVPLLFPVVDILNHSVAAKVEWDFQPKTSFTLKLLDNEAFTAGEELFNNYAPKQNDELLLGYGFCLADNPIEQFALKLALLPMLQQYAEETGLFKPENVPFGMNTDFLSKDPNTEQHFLRAIGHPFGRYENRVPFFRGIPPYIVHFFFIQTLLSLDLDVGVVNIERPGPRFTLHVLTLLHQAISQRAQTLPLSISQQPQNDKQTYAKIYRDGQAKIIHAVRDELQSALDRIRAPKGEVPPTRPALITPTEALAALTAEFSHIESQRFKSALVKHGLHSPADDRLIWTLLLACLVAYSLTCKDPEKRLTDKWLRTLYDKYPLPTLEDGIEDADTYTFVDENLSDFLRLPDQGNNEDVTETLDNIGAVFENGGDSLRKRWPVLVREKTENLGVRIIMWAMKVVDGESIPLLEDGAVSMGMYVVPWMPGNGTGKGDEWVYEEL